MENFDVVAVARALATEAHQGQERKYEGLPYIVHPQRVAEIVATVPHTDEMIAAAWLHDVVEDCDVDLGYIYQCFGLEIGNLVMWLTNRSKGVMTANRAIRKHIDLQVLRNAPAQAQTIKYADLIDNTASIVEHDPKFAKLYLQEKKALLEAMTGGNYTLWRQAWDLTMEGMERVA